MRAAAVFSMTDQKLLAEIAKNDLYEKKRTSAFCKLVDQQLLADIAKNDRDWDIRREATRHLMNQEFLADLAKNDASTGVRGAATENLKDLNLLADIAKNDGAQQVRSNAVMKLVLCRLASTRRKEEHEGETLSVDAASPPRSRDRAPDFCILERQGIQRDNSPTRVTNVTMGNAARTPRLQGRDERLLVCRRASSACPSCACIRTLPRTAQTFHAARTPRLQMTHDQ